LRPGAAFTGPADSSGNVELSFRIDGDLSMPTYEFLEGEATVTAGAELGASGKAQVGGAGNVGADATVVPA